LYLAKRTVQDGNFKETRTAVAGTELILYSCIDENSVEVQELTDVHGNNRK